MNAYVLVQATAICFCDRFVVHQNGRNKKERCDSGASAFQEPKATSATHQNRQDVQRRETQPIFQILRLLPLALQKIEGTKL